MHRCLLWYSHARAIGNLQAFASGNSCSWLAGKALRDKRNAPPALYFPSGSLLSSFPGQCDHLTRQLQCSSAQRTEMEMERGGEREVSDAPHAPFPDSSSTVERTAPNIPDILVKTISPKLQWRLRR